MKLGDLVKKKCIVPWVGVIIERDAHNHPYDKNGGRWVVQWSCGRQEPAWGADIEVLNEAR